VLRVIRLLDIIPTFEGQTQALASFSPQGPDDITGSE
jgi:hypothetical protein